MFCPKSNSVDSNLLSLFAQRVQLEKFFIKEAADSFEGWTTLYLGIFQRTGHLESNALISFKEKIIQQYEKHIKNCCNAYESINRLQTQNFHNKQPEEKIKRLIEKNLTKKTGSFLETFSKLKFWPRFSEIPIVKKYTNQIHKNTTQSKTFTDLKLFLNEHTFGEKILMLIDIHRQSNSIGKNKLKTAITSEEWKWCTRELTRKLSMQLKESKETAAKFLDDRTFDTHIKNALNTLFEEVLAQALLKKTIT